MPRKSYLSLIATALICCLFWSAAPADAQSNRMIVGKPVQKDYWTLKPLTPPLKPVVQKPAPVTQSSRIAPLAPLSSPRNNSNNNNGFFGAGGGTTTVAPP